MLDGWLFKDNYYKYMKKTIEINKVSDTEIEKINNEIKSYEDQIVVLDVYIQDAVSKGVIKDSDVIPTPEPVVDNPVVEPITPVEPVVPIE